MTSERQWVEIHLPLSSNCLEILSALLFAEGAEGLEERKNDVVVYFSRQRWNNDLKISLMEKLKQIQSGLNIQILEERLIREENWNEAWKENFKTFRLTERIIITPEWEEYKPGADETLIIINPKMAFGTGHHETTQLILELMDEYLQQEQSVLDAGTGSGILAIYAAKQGAYPVVAFDTDPLAIENLAENAELNGVLQHITAILGTLEQTPKRHFDLIVANINRNVLLDLAESFAEFQSEKGVLLLSGILKSDSGIVRKIYEKAHYRFIGQKNKNEWIAMVFQRKD
ncbi:MAG TPA: 50S ribosomal protein L11 methyltransferase [Calditrichaeota bacterium]|nr:50S ribosomal protein L11 methyltransferase [Calditrichota bacterium]